MILRDVALSVANPEAVAERYPNQFVQRLGLHTCCVEGLFLACLRNRLRTPDTTKLVIELSDDRQEFPSTADVRQLLTIVFVPWPFDFGTYKTNDEQNRRQVLFETVHEATRWLGQLRGWDTAVIDAAYGECVDRQFKYCGFWEKKTWLSPNGKYRIKVYFEFGLEQLELFAVLFRGANMELGRQKLGWVVPQIDAVRAAIGDGRWLSNSEFQLDSRSLYFKSQWKCDFGTLIV